MANFLSICFLVLFWSFSLQSQETSSALNLFSSDRELNSSVEERYQLLKSKKGIERVVQRKLNEVLPNLVLEDWKNQEEIKIQLLDKKTEVLAHRSQVIQEVNTGHITWIGHVSNNSANLVILTIKDDNLSGIISLGQDQYSIKPLGAGAHALYLYNQEWKRGGKDFLIPQVKEAPLFTPPEQIPNDNGDFIDLYVVYTTDAANASSDIVGEIVTTVAYTNTILKQSCVFYRYRLVGTDPVTYSNDLNSVTGDKVLTDLTNGIIPQVATSRNALGADLVQIWVENISDVCGIAWAPSVATSDPSNGFSLIVRYCPAFVMAHELGHNMSLSHDRYQTGTSKNDLSADYGTGYGYVSLKQAFVTVMSYTTECTSFSLNNCSYIPYFSNPNILYKNEIIGVPGLINSVDKLNNSKFAIANMKQSVTSYSVDVTSGCTQVAEKKNKLAGCFIATAAFGDYNHPYVKILRRFRSEVLLRSQLGKRFVDWYYKISPPLADIIEKSQPLRGISMALLTPVVMVIKYPYWTLIGLLFSSLIVSLLYLFLLHRKKNVSHKH